MFFILFSLIVDKILQEKSTRQSGGQSCENLLPLHVCRIQHYLLDILYDCVKVQLGPPGSDQIYFQRNVRFI